MVVVIVGKCFGVDVGVVFILWFCGGCIICGCLSVSWGGGMRGFDGCCGVWVLLVFENRRICLCYGEDG